MAIENVVLTNLIYNEDYARKVLPYLKEEYFPNQSQKVIYSLINNYINKYNALPSKEALTIDLSNLSNVSEDTFKTAKNDIETFAYDEKTNIEWLLNQTEQFCQDKAIYNAIMSSIQILDNKKGELTTGSIPKILSDALAVSFDPHVGHDFIEDAPSRFEFYHQKEVRIPFDLDYFNKITQGGLPKKTLNICLAGCVHPETRVKIRYRK